MSEVELRTTLLAQPEPDGERMARLKRQLAYGQATHIQRGATRGQPIHLKISAADFDWLVDLAERALARQ